MWLHFHMALLIYILHISELFNTWTATSVQHDDKPCTVQRTTELPGKRQLDFRKMTVSLNKITVHDHRPWQWQLKTTGAYCCIIQQKLETYWCTGGMYWPISNVEKHYNGLVSHPKRMTAIANNCIHNASCHTIYQWL
jgi:hypothetical protein